MMIYERIIGALAVITAAFFAIIGYGQSKKKQGKSDAENDANQKIIDDLPKRNRRRDKINRMHIDDVISELRNEDGDS